MTQVLSVVDRKKVLTWKSHGKITKTEEYVELNKLTLNTNKTELIFFSRNNSDFASIFYKNEVLTTQKSHRYSSSKITCAFTLIIFGNLFSKFISKKPKTLIQTKTLPAELIIAEMSLIKFHYDIAWLENSESFHGHLSLHQNTRTKQFKFRQNAKNSFGLNSIVRQCVQK